MSRRDDKIFTLGFLEKTSAPNRVVTYRISIDKQNQLMLLKTTRKGLPAMITFLPAWIVAHMLDCLTDAVSRFGWQAGALPDQPDIDEADWGRDLPIARGCRIEVTRAKVYIVWTLDIERNIFSVVQIAPETASVLRHDIDEAFAAGDLRRPGGDSDRPVLDGRAGP